MSQWPLVQENERHRFLQRSSERKIKVKLEWNACLIIAFKTRLKTVSNVEIIGNSFIVALKIYV